MRTYFAFCDPSGGSSDSMTQAIAHRALLGKVVLDGFWERRPPFSPDDVTREFAAILTEYRITKVTGDKYAAQWVVERLREYGVTYQPSELNRSEIYVAFVALLNSGRVKFPADSRLRTQFESLERRASRTGRDVVDHLPGGHDDVANAVAGALVLAAAGSAARREPFHPQFIEVSRDRKARWVGEELGPNDCGPARWWTQISECGSKRKI